MGMFDSLYVDCTCGKQVEFQSKSGECSLARYTVDNCPHAIAADLIGQWRYCDCGNVLTLRGAVTLLVERSP
jgi:hypothetical protein